MPTTVNTKTVGYTAGSSLNLPLINLGAVSVANAFRNLGSWFQSVGSGSRSFYGYTASGGVRASGTVTFSSIAAADTVTINGVTFTGSDTPTGNNQFLTGTTDTASAASLATLINASTAPDKIVNVLSATSALGVITITCVESGQIGNLCTLAISAHGSVSGANFTGGTDGTVVSMIKGL